MPSQGEGHCAMQDAINTMRVDGYTLEDIEEPAKNAFKHREGVLRPPLRPGPMHRVLSHHRLLSVIIGEPSSRNPASARQAIVISPSISIGGHDRSHGSGQEVGPLLHDALALLEVVARLVLLQDGV